MCEEEWRDLLIHYQDAYAMIQARQARLRARPGDLDAALTIMANAVRGAGRELFPTGITVAGFSMSGEHEFPFVRGTVLNHLDSGVRVRDESGMTHSINWRECVRERARITLVGDER